MKDLVQMVNTSHKISAATQRMMYDLVNKVYEAFLPAQSYLHKTNVELDNDLQSTLVDEKTANDQLTELGVTLKQLREKENTPKLDLLELEKRVDRERVDLNEAISFAQTKKVPLEKAKNTSPLKAVGSALIGLPVGGPAGLAIGACVGGTVAYADLEKAVDAAQDAKRRAEQRLEHNQRELRNVKSDLEELEKLKREKSEQLKMIEKRKQEIKQRKEQLASLIGSVKSFITLVDTTTSRAEMMAKEVNGELPDIAAIMVPLKAIASDICEKTLTNKCLFSGHVEFSFTEIEKMKNMSPGDIDQWA